VAGPGSGKKWYCCLLLATTLDFKIDINSIFQSSFPFVYENMCFMLFSNYCEFKMSQIGTGRYKIDTTCYL